MTLINFARPRPNARNARSEEYAALVAHRRAELALLPQLIAESVRPVPEYRKPPR